MKITTFLLPAAALVSTASAFLADCSCINGQPPFWNADIERLITEKVAPSYLYPREYSIRALDRLYVQYHNVEVVVTTTREAVKLTRPAFRDLLWE